jgi:DNA-binding NtrC family response regulator
MLIAHFVRIFAQRHGKAIEHVPDDAMRAIERYNWPRQHSPTANVVERAVILTRDGELRIPR